VERRGRGILAGSLALLALAVIAVIGEQTGHAVRASGSEVLPRAKASLTTTGRRPNVLIILTDDQRLPETMSVMPRTRRWFGSQGRTFTNAVSTTPLCCPSRSSILSGRYAHNHGVLQNENRGELNQHYTIERYLHDAGYTTGIFGKLLNYWDACKRPPYWDRWTMINGLYENFFVGRSGSCKATFGYTTTYLKDRALAFLRDETPRIRPWFMYLAVTAPHDRGKAGPPVPERKYRNARIPSFRPPASYFEPDRSDKPPWIASTPPWNGRTIREEREGTLRTLRSVDDMVNEVLVELDRSGEADNTLAFFLSDNGFMWGEHAQISKGRPYLESARVPMYMRWPEAVAAGSVDTRLVGNIDLLPTILDATAVRHSGPAIDGRSLLDQTWSRDRILLEFWSAFIEPPNPREPTFASTIGSDYQYTEYYEDDAATPKQWPTGDPLATGPVREYYNLSDDPLELTNLLHDGNPANDPVIEPLLSDQLARDRRCAGHGPGPDPPPCP
jgi:arylsulfatase A-like enzyme